MLPLDEMRVLDRNAEWMGVKILDLMENAGKAIAQTALKEMEAKGKHVVIVCGTGNNGGDGLTAARFMKGNADVSILLAKPPSELSTQEALANYERVKDAVEIGVAGDDAEDRLRAADVIVDALLGIGTRGEVREPYASLIAAINASGTPVLSVDVPSGFGTATAVSPKATIALHDAKEGMHEENSGDVYVADIGIPEEVARTIGPGELLLYPVPSPDAHKGDSGRVLVVSGGPFTGAPSLCGLAAYRIGVDIVHIATPSSAFPAVSGFSPTFIVHGLGGTRLIPDDVPRILELAAGMSSVVVGPGLGASDDTLEAVRQVVRAVNVPLALDADVFSALAGHLDVLAGRTGVLTPHAKEFEVASGAPIPEGGRESAAADLAKRTGLAVLLKGPEDVVSDGERTKVNRTGNAGMTVGGTGDVLAGIVGGLLAKGCAPFDAARMAAFVSGYAGDLAFEDLSYGFTALDVAERVPLVLRKFL